MLERIEDGGSTKGESSQAKKTVDGLETTNLISLCWKYVRCWTKWQPLGLKNEANVEMPKNCSSSNGRLRLAPKHRLYK